MGTWAASGYEQVATSHLHLVKRKCEEKERTEDEEFIFQAIKQ